MVLALCTTSLVTHGQDASSSDNREEAERLFDEGRELMMTPGKLDAACDTLARSLELMERGDTYLNLAECHRRQGKTATSWREFGKALEHAKTVEFKEAIETAKTIRDGLEAKLSRLTVRVDERTAALEGLAIELNGEPLPRDQWGTAMILDPQTYTVKATATGHQDFSSSVELGDDKDNKEVVVALEPVVPPPTPAPAPPPPPAPKPEPPPSTSDGGVHPLTIIGFAVAGAGFIAYGVTGGLALDRRAGFDEDCPDDLCPAGREDDIDEAILLADVASGMLAVGLAGTAVGLFSLFYFDLNDGEASAAIDIGPGTIGVRGSF